MGAQLPLATQGGQEMSWIAVWVGASDPMGAWRPELFGQTLAALSQRAPTGYVFIGTERERKAIHLAQVILRKAGGTDSAPATPWEKRHYNLPPCSPSADSC